MPSLEEQIQKVREAQMDRNKYAAMVAELYERFDLEHSGLLANLKASKENQEIEEGILREMALIAYQETGNKKPAAGVGVRIVKEAIYEPKAAFGWALEHKTCLALDTKAYEALMKAGQDVPGTLRESVQATIAKEL